MSSIKEYQARLNKLERFIKPSLENPSEAAFTFQKILTASMISMEPRHRKQFIDALQVWVDVHIHRTKPLDTPLPSACRILDVLIESHFLNKSDEIPSFGPEVFAAVCNGQSLTEMRRRATK